MRTATKVWLWLAILATVLLIYFVGAIELLSLQIIMFGNGNNLELFLNLDAVAALILWFVWGTSYMFTDHQ